MGSRSNAVGNFIKFSGSNRTQVLDLKAREDGSILLVTTQSWTDHGGYDIGCGCYYEGGGTTRSALLNVLRSDQNTFVVESGTESRSNAFGRVYVAGAFGRSYFLMEGGEVILFSQDHSHPRLIPPAGVGLDLPLGAVETPDGRLIIAATNFGGGDVYLTYVTRDGQFGPVVPALNADGTSVLQASPNAFSNRVFLDAEGKLVVVAGAIGKFSVKRALVEPRQFPDGRANDIVVDDQNRAHFAYFDARTRVLMYAQRSNGGFWSAARVLDAEPGAGEHVSITLDRDQRPVIAYFAAANADLKLAWHTGTEWRMTTLDRRGSVGQYPSVFVGSDHRPAVAYYAKSTGDLRVASLDRETGNVSRETVDSAGDVGRSTSADQLLQTGRMAVAYVSSSTGEVRVAERRSRGRGWAIQTLAYTASGADFLSLDYSAGSYQTPAVSFYDSSTADLRLARRSSLGSADELQHFTIASRGAVGLYSGIGGSGYMVYGYDRSKDSLVRYTFNNTTEQYDATAIAVDGGRYLSLGRSGSYPSIAAYLDTASGRLEVMNLHH